jgi:hypothetical protein
LLDFARRFQTLAAAHAQILFTQTSLTCAVQQYRLQLANLLYDLRCLIDSRGPEFLLNTGLFSEPQLFLQGLEMAAGSLVESEDSADLDLCLAAAYKSHSFALSILEDSCDAFESLGLQEALPHFALPNIDELRAPAASQPSDQAKGKGKKRAKDN